MLSALHDSLASPERGNTGRGVRHHVNLDLICVRKLIVEVREYWICLKVVGVLCQFNDRQRHKVSDLVGTGSDNRLPILHVTVLLDDLHGDKLICPWSSYAAQTPNVL